MIAALAVQRSVRPFPVPPVERRNRALARRDIVKTMEIDAPAIRVRAGLVEALYPANSTKKMLGLSGAEAVARQRSLLARQLELRVRHDQMVEPRHAARGTIAVEQFDRRGDFRLEADRPAMATAANLHSTVTDFARLRG